MSRLLLGLLCLAITGCRLSFDTSVEGSAQIPGDPSPLPGLLNTFPVLAGFTSIDFAQNQDFENQGVSKNNVDSVRVVGFQLAITSPSNQDFSFLDSIQFYASTQGQPEVLIAEKSGISELVLPAPNPVLTLDLKDVELQPYVVAPSMSITVKGQGQAPRYDTDLKATVTLNVDAHL